MRKNFLKRTLAGVLSAVTLCSSMAVSVPTAFAAEEDNKASAIEIKVGETYNVADKGVSKAWFQQNGAPRNVWPMFTKASDGTEIRAYCADHAKGNPGTGGKPYTVTGQVKDMRVYGVVVKSDSRNTLNTFISVPRCSTPVTLPQICIFLLRRLLSGVRWEMHRLQLTVSSA